MELKNKNFLIIAGVPKAGTSSLYNYFKSHSDIFVPEQKELHFFSSEALEQRTSGPNDKEALQYISNTKAKYLKHFEGATNQKVLVDISPSYFFFAESAVEKIKRELSPSKVKIVIALRDPIERTFSNYMHKVRLLLEEKSFLEALKAEEIREEQDYGDFWLYKAHSLYGEKLKYYYKEFGKENVKVVLFEDIKNQPEQVCKEIFEFAGVDPSVELQGLGKIHNQGGVLKKSRITKFLVQPNKAKFFLRKLFPDFLAKKILTLKNKFLEKQLQQKPEMEEEALAYLKAYFKEDVRVLQEELNLDTSKWKHFKN